MVTKSELNLNFVKTEDDFLVNFSLLDKFLSNHKYRISVTYAIYLTPLTMYRSLVPNTRIKENNTNHSKEIAKRRSRKTKKKNL